MRTQEFLREIIASHFRKAKHYGGKFFAFHIGKKIKKVCIYCKKEFDKTINIARKRLGKRGIVGVVNYTDKRYEDFSKLPGYDRTNIGNAIYIPEKEILIIKGQETPTRKVQGNGARARERRRRRRRRR